MLIYFLIFLISILFAYFGNKNSKKPIKYTCNILAVLIPSVFAGIRAKGVGTDTLLYIDAAFRFATMSTSFTHLLDICNIEILYNLVNYIVSRFTSIVNYAYFALQLLICGFAYLACYKNKKICKPWLSYLMFLLLFYNRSLNMCRQSIAIVITMYSFSYILEKKSIKFIILNLIAIGFHRTAIFFLPGYFLVNVISKKSNLSFIYKILIFMLFFSFLIGYKSIITAIVNTGLISDRYLFYVASEKSNIILIELILKIIVLTLVLVFNKKLKSLNEYNHVLIFFMILDILLYSTGIYANYAQRISYYFGYYIIFLIPQLNCIFKGNNTKKIFELLIIICVMIYSYLYYDVAKYDETVPYKTVIKIGD